MWSTGRSEAALEAALPAPIRIIRVRNAKRLRLRIDDASGTLRLTCPWRMSRRSALAWALEQSDWISEQLARAVPFTPFAPGAVIPIEGRPSKIVWDHAAARAPQLANGELRVGGPRSGLPRRVESFLKAHALETMSREVGEYAALAGVMAASVSVGDAASRWGSCSSRRTIRLNWRLILAPPEVRRYVVAHEVAHLVHLDHSPKFKVLEERLYGDGLAEAKAALRSAGPRLRRIGRDG
jgi:predicted metal-dependent hydrolase